MHRGVRVAEHAGEQADDGVHDDQRGQFAAGEDIVSDGDLTVAEEGVDALVDAFIAAAEEDDAVQCGQFPGDGLGERTALGREEDDGFAGGSRTGLSARARVWKQSKMGSGLRTMPSPPPKGRSSTVRWRSWVKARRSWVRRSTRPARAARATTPWVSGLTKKSGKMEMRSMRMGCGRLGGGTGEVEFNEARWEIHLNAAARGVHGEDESLNVGNKHFVTGRGYHCQQRSNLGVAFSLGGCGKTRRSRWFRSGARPQRSGSQ